MSGEQELRQAIQMMQNGEVGSAVALLNRLVGSAELDHKARAAAYVWLAESRDDHDFKIRCLERALEAEPENRQIQQGLHQLLATNSPPDHLPGRRAADVQVLERAPSVVGIDGVANSATSGVFISQDGLLATTSYAVGSAEGVSVAIESERSLAGQVVRRDPLQDIALIHTPVRLARKPVAVPSTMIGANMPFVALSVDGTRLRGRLLPSRGAGALQWLGTNLPAVQVPNAGGNPLYDEKGQLLGILTRNTDAAGCVYAISITQIMGLAEAWQRDRRLLPNSGYCKACGGLCRAIMYGGRYCETCGAVLSASDGSAPMPPQIAELQQLYGENQSRACPHCGAGVGTYSGRCLRCGQAMSRPAVADG